MQRILILVPAAALALVALFAWSANDRADGAAPLQIAREHPSALTTPTAQPLEPVTRSDASERSEASTGVDRAATSTPVVPLVAGIVVDEQGGAIAGAIVDAWVAGTPIPERGEAPTATGSGADGRFVLTRELDAARLCVRARHPRYLTSRIHEIDRGVTTLRLTLPSGGSLPVSILLPSPRNYGDFELRFANEETGEIAHTFTWLGETGARSSTGSARISASEQASDDGSQTVIMLDTHFAPGTYALSISLREADESLTLVPHVVVQDAVENRDPRVDPIDLRDLVYARCLRVVDDKGSPISTGWRQVLDHGAGLPGKRGAFQNGSACFYARAPRVDVLVGADGFRTAKLGAVGENRDVVLLRAFAYELTVLGAKPPEAPAVLRAVLAPRSKFERNTDAVWRLDTDGLDVAMLERLAEEAPFVRAVDVPSDGRVVLGAPEPGSYEVRFFVAVSESGSSTLSIAEVDVPARPTVEIVQERANGTFTLDARRLEEALARVRADGR